MFHSRRIGLVLGCVLVIALPAAAQQARTKVILDTDIGTDIDDGWALGYALKSPIFELVGVTVTDGDTPQRARLAWRNRRALSAHRRECDPPKGRILR